LGKTNKRGSKQKINKQLWCEAAAVSNYLVYLCSSFINWDQGSELLYLGYML